MNVNRFPLPAARSLVSGVPALEVEGLRVRYGARRVLHDLSLSIAPAEVVALVGESGSGKTTAAQAIIGLLPTGGVREAGAIRLNGEDIAGWPERRLAPLRGARVSLVPQDPTTSLNPVRTIGAQIAEVFELHGERDREQRRALTLALLERVGLTPAPLRARQYPHELSGGMRQRVLIAMAVALRPGVIIADEPTSALDVTVQCEVLDLLDELRREDGTAMLLVTHDLGIAHDRAGQVVVLRHGQVQEEGPVRQVFAAPRSAYAAQLLRDAPGLATPRPRPPARPATGTALRVAGLVQDYPGTGGAPFRAVDGVSFAVPEGTTHALVGESGSGKTTTARAVAGFLRPSAGLVEVHGTDVTALRGEALRRMRREVQLVFQNPFASLDPRQGVADIIEEPLRNFERISTPERRRRVADMAERVGLAPDLLARRPAALSGGQRQRVAIARALVLRPRVLVLDEAVSALDVTVQASVLALLSELQREFGLTYLFVSHDLAVVRLVADTVSVMRGGRVVEAGPVEQVFHAPQTDYVRALIAAVPGAAAARAA